MDQDNEAEPSADHTLDKDQKSSRNGSESVVEIRKYSNRRLYDTSSSRYITLSELGDMIRSGTNIRVRDARTGQDLTRMVMLQIILENEHDIDLLPISFLRTIIEAGSEAMADSFRMTLTSTMEVLSHVHEEFLSQFNEMTQIGATAWPPLAFQWMSFINRYFQSLSASVKPSGLEPEKKEEQPQKPGRAPKQP